MKTIKQDYEVLVNLLTSSWIAAEGVRAVRTMSGPVAIWQRGHYLGVWWHEDKEYRFARVAFQTPERTARTADEALAKTIALVVRKRGANPRRSRDPWLRFTSRMSG